MSYFETLFGYEWELTKSPAGAHQWKLKDPAAATTVADAHDPSKRHAPMMTTADMAIRMDPAYEKISRHFMANPQEFHNAFTRVRFELTHRDMCQPARYLGKLVPAEVLIWQVPLPTVNHSLVDANDIASLKGTLLAFGLDWSALHGRRPRSAAAATNAAAPTARSQAASRFRWPTSSFWAAARPSKRRRRTPAMRPRPGSPRAAPTPDRTRPMLIHSHRWSRWPTVSATTFARDLRERPPNCWRTSPIR